MEATDPSSKESKLELYTIPAHSSWFIWNDIHEIERREFGEFFTESSITRTPKVYKEYRDFIINKFREDPSRKLTFTSIRKFLVGDVNLLQKVFLFLEKWGLINFNSSLFESEVKHNAKVEEGIPAGIRITSAPNSLRPITVPPLVEERAESAFKSPPLTSYSDVFSELKKSSDGEKNSVAAVWTEEEILLLLESVLKHGDDWELIAQSVSTKSRLDCISKLIELPFGEFLMGSASGRLQNSSDEHKETETEKEEKEKEDNNVDDEDEPPAKRKRGEIISDNDTSLMKQVAAMASKMGPSVTTAAAKAAVEALCDEASCPKDIFDMDEIKEDKEGTQDLPVALRIRASVGTALGAVAAHAKLLADQEEREMEHLVATVIDQQLKKLQSKLKFMDHLELIMDAEEKVIEDLKEQVLHERISVLEGAFRSGITKRWDHNYVK